MSNQTNSQNNELFEAAERNDLETVRTFVEQKNTTVSVSNEGGQTVAHIAAKNGNIDMLRYIVDKDPTILALTDRNATTILQLAVEKKFMKAIEYLEGKYVPQLSKLNHRDFQSAVVHIAIQHGHLDIVKYFMEEKKCDVNIRDDLNETTAFTAVQNRRRDIFDYLVDKKNADLTALDRYGENILFEFVRTNDLQWMMHILDEKKIPLDVNWRNNFGDTMLHRAALLNRLYLIEYLVGEKNADVNAVGCYKLTPLHCAAYRNHYETCRYLIEHGANVRAEDEKGETPVQKASDEQLVEYMKNISSIRTRRSVEVPNLPSLQPVSMPRGHWYRNSIGAHRLPPTAGFETDASLTSPLNIDSSVFRNFLALAESLVSNTKHRKRNHFTVPSPSVLLRGRVDPLAEDAINTLPLT